jgi:ribosomal protein L7/L12
MIKSEFEELRERLNRIEHNLATLMRHLGSAHAGTEWQLIATDESKKILAIKKCREVTGLGLREAKEMVEDFMYRRKQ